MNRVNKSVGGILILLVIPSLRAAPAQERSGEPASVVQQSKPAGQEQPLEPRKRILAVLDHQLEAQKTFADDNLRIAVQATIGDMLWGFDEPRARRVLEEAFRTIASLPLDERGRPVRQGYPMSNLLIRVIAGRDPAMALRLQQSVEIPPDVDPEFTAAGRFGNVYSERARIQNDLAMHIVMEEVRSGELENALQAVRPFVERGDLQRLISLIRQIRVKDAAAADQMFSQAIARARLGQPGFGDIRSLSWYVFPNLGEGVFRFSDKKVDPFETTPISTELRDQFLNLAYDTVSRRLDSALAGDGDARLNVGNLLDYALPYTLAAHFDRFMPAKAPAFRARLAEVARRVPPEEQPYLALAEPGFERLLAIADKLSEGRMRDNLYQAAARRATRSGELDRASGIIEKIGNDFTRATEKESLRIEFDNHRIQETYIALGAKDLDKAEKLIVAISDPRHRLSRLASLISVWFQKDKARATSMLDEAEQRASAVDNPVDRALQLKMLAGIALDMDRQRGIEKLGLAIDEINRAGFTPEWQRHESVETRGGYISRNVSGGVGDFLDDREFIRLGQIDLDRALGMAERLQPREASALAQLAACRGILARLQPRMARKTTSQKRADEKAMALLEKLAEAAASFEDVELRIRMQAQIADVLWVRDQARARKLFEKVFAATATVPLPSPTSTAPPSYIGADSHFPLRNDLVRLVARRDPDLASRLIESVVDQPPNVDQKFINTAYGNYSEQGLLRHQFALSIAENEPQRAARVAVALLEKGDIRSALSIADSLPANERALKDEVLGKTLSLAKQTKAVSGDTVRLLAAHIFPGFGEGVIQFRGGQRVRPPADDDSPNRALRDQFLELARAAVKQWIEARRPGAQSSPRLPSNAPDLVIARLLLPYFDRYLPAESIELRAALQEVAGVQTNAPLNDAESIEALLNRAQGVADPEERDRIYWGAFMRALRARKPDQARAILAQVGSTRMRAQLEDELRRDGERAALDNARVAIESGDFDGAYELISGVSDRSRRVSMLGYLALALSYRKNTDRALQILGDIEQLNAKAEDPTERAEEMVRTANTAARIDIERGFEAARLAVASLNRSSIAPQWVKIEDVTDATGRVTSRRHVGFQLLASFLLDGTFSELARSDFDRALQLAQTLQMREASVFAQLGVCRAVLR